MSVPLVKIELPYVSSSVVADRKKRERGRRKTAARGKLRTVARNRKFDSQRGWRVPCAMTYGSFLRASHKKSRLNEILLTDKEIT